MWIVLILVLASLFACRYFIVHRLNLNLDPINAFLARFCDQQAVFEPKDFEWTSSFRDEWKTIRDEYLQFEVHNELRLFKSINADVSSIDIANGWKVVLLRVYGVNTHLATRFPKTMQLIERCPCTLAFFSVFEPNTKLTQHRGLYKGVIRYHLPLVVPDEWDKCFINVHGRVLNWRIHRDKPIDLMFDDLYLHHAENNTNQRRVVLFLDIKRDFKNPIINAINSILLRFIRSNDAVNKTVRVANAI